MNRSNSYEDGLTDRAKFWVDLVQKIGFPIVVAGVLLGGAWFFFSALANSHITFLDELIAQSKNQTHILEKIVENQGVIIDHQKNIKMVVENQIRLLENQEKLMRTLSDAHILKNGQ